MYKKFFRTTLILIVVALVAFGSIIYVFDPYFKYHAPYFGLKPNITSNIYQNPGLASNFDYDSIIIGSSMTENFRASWFDEAFDANTMKLSYPAGRLHNYSFILKKAYENNDIENVFWGLDIDPLIDEHLKDYFEMPEYMYDDNMLTDVNYVLNKSILFQSVCEMIVKNKNNQIRPIDEAYTWDYKSNFSKESVINSYWFPEKIKTDVDYSYYMDNAKLNLELMLPLINDHPETKFYIFVPPYSILFWHYRFAKNDLETVMSVLDYALGELLNYDNVRLFYFQNDENIITNLDNYKDYTHYNGEINRYILESMRDGKYEVNGETYKNELKKMYILAKEYNYDSIKE